jgi:hypothetical protein
MSAPAEPLEALIADTREIGFELSEGIPVGGGPRAGEYDTQLFGATVTVVVLGRPFDS